MRLFDQKNNLEIAAVAIFSLGLITSSLEDASAEEEIFPLWLKDIAVWWGEEQITDQDFVNTLQYLVEKNILAIPDRDFGEPVCDSGLILNKTSSDCIINDESESKGIFIDAVNEHIIFLFLLLYLLWYLFYYLRIFNF